jgi:hypothetical protein
MQLRRTFARVDQERPQASALGREDGQIGRGGRRSLPRLGADERDGPASSRLSGGRRGDAFQKFSQSPLICSARPFGFDRISGDATTAEQSRE